MFWDGSRWIDERSLVTKPPTKTSHHRPRRWFTVIAIMFGVMALSLPSLEPVSARTAAVQPSAAWSAEYDTRTFQETWKNLSVKGNWWRGHSSRFVGGRALSARQKGASLKVSFSGTGIAIVGPKSKLRGNARIYVDGRYVKTVSAYS